MRQPLKIDSRLNGAAPDVLPLPAPAEAAEPAAAPPLGGNAAALLTAAVYTPDEVAALFKVSRRVIERWAAAGKLPGARLPLPGRMVRYRRDLIDRWLIEGLPTTARPRRSR